VTPSDALRARLLAMTPEQRAALLAEVRRRLAEDRLADYVPYPKQSEFHAAGGPLTVRERLLIAANQVGKTLSASREIAMHLTGRYPDWWKGTTFDEPTKGWAASETGQSTRDNVQRLLLGDVGAWGTGAVPKDAIVDIKRAVHGVPDLVDTIMVRFGGGGDVQADVSRLVIKTYDQGRLRWQGETLEFVWFDEEPPQDIYFEGLTRTNATNGFVMLTFTPLKGMSEVVRRFLMDKPAGSVVTHMTIDDAHHYSAEKRAQIIASYPPHEREARAKGIPVLGSGRIFPIPEETIAEAQAQIPRHWPRIAGIDFGWDHPTAVVWIAWDRETDTAHVYDAYRVREATPAIHSLAITAKGKWIPIAWPHDGEQHDKGSGEALAHQYRVLGCNMLPAKATHRPDAKQGQKEGEGGNSVEAGLMDMLDRMQTGRLRVARHLNDWWEEFRLYHREDGRIVKEHDDLMSATRYALMMLRHARVNTEQQQRKLPGFVVTDQATGLLG
jgi:phage terminase large subunit-like protein